MQPLQQGYQQALPPNRAISTQTPNDRAMPVNEQFSPDRNNMNYAGRLNRGRGRDYTDLAPPDDDMDRLSNRSDQVGYARPCCIDWSHCDQFKLSILCQNHRETDTQYTL